MKIMVITSLYKPYRRGGAEVIAEKVVKALKGKGHDVFVVSAGKSDTLETIDDIEVYRVNPGNIFNYIDIQAQPLWKRAIWHLIDQNSQNGAKKVLEILEKRKPDLILSHSLKGLGYTIPQVISKTKIPYVHTLHDVQLSIPSGLIIKGHEKDFFVRNPYNWFFEKRNKKLFSYCDKVVSPSQWLIDFYVKRGFFEDNQPIVLRNPVDVTRGTVEKKYNYSYCYVGQLEEHKGVTYLLRNFQQFHSDHPEVRLVVVGSGSLDNVLREHYKNESWVQFLGFVNYKNLATQVFDNISYSILPSLCYENSPNLIIDSFVNSTPSIVADIGGSSELVKDGENGFVFSCASDDSLKKALERSYDFRNIYDNLSREARKTVASLGIDLYIEKLFKIAGLE